MTEVAGEDVNDTPGGKQEMSIVSEPGLYSLILRSRKPEAKAFKRWVTHEVIPSIRKTGSYGTGQKTALPFAISTPLADRLAMSSSKPPFLDRSGGFALSRGCPDPELIAVSAGSFNEANVLEPHRR